MEEKQCTVDFSQLMLGKKFAQGADSRIYHGTYKNKHVAVKILQVQEQENQAKRLEKQYDQEVSILSRLRHPNVVEFVGACSKETTVYCILTEFVPEGSLSSYLSKLERSNTRLPLEKIVVLGLGIARGMEYVHSQGIIHRDIKPDNILIDHGCKLKVADFSVSCEEKRCDFGDVGTLRWMAPEMIRRKKYDRKVDVYSFGLILNHMISGSSPFGNMGPVQVAYGVANKNLRPTISNECPVFMTKLIERCWCENPKKRPEFSEIVTILEKFEATVFDEGKNMKTLQQCVNQDHKKGLSRWIQKFCISF